MPEAFLILRLDSPSNMSPTVIKAGERVEVVGGGCESEKTELKHWLNRVALSRSELTEEVPEDKIRN